MVVSAHIALQILRHLAMVLIQYNYAHVKKVILDPMPRPAHLALQGHTLTQQECCNVLRVRPIHMTRPPIPFGQVSWFVQTSQLTHFQQKDQLIIVVLLDIMINKRLHNVINATKVIILIMVPWNVQSVSMEILYQLQ